MKSLRIADPETVRLVDRLAEARSISKTEAVKEAVSADLERRGIAAGEAEKAAAGGSVLDLLEREVRSNALEYARFNAALKGKKGVGSRAWGTLAKYGPVETVERYVLKPGGSEGFRMLAESDRLDLAYEKFVLDPRFADLFGAEARAVAAIRMEDTK